MIREPKNNFDEHIKEALQGFEMPFESDDWALMEQKLNREDSKAGLVLFFSNKYLQLGVAAALLLCVLYNVGQWSQDANIDLVEQHTPPTQKSLSNTSQQIAEMQNIEKELATTANVEKDFSLTEEKAQTNASMDENNKQTATLFDILPSKKATTNNTITAYDQKNTFNFNNEIISREQKKNIEQFAGTNTTFNQHQNFQTANTQTSSFDKNNILPTPDLSTTNQVARVISHNINALQDVNNANILATKATNINSVFPLANRNANFVDESNKNILRAALEIAKPLSDFSSLVETPKVPRKKAKLSVGSHLAFDVNFVDANWTEAGFSTGLSFNIGKNKRWGLQTGLFHSYKNFATSKFDRQIETTNNTFWAADNYEAEYALNSFSSGTSIQQQNQFFNIEAFFIEIPLLLTHNFSPNGQFNPYISAGASVWLPTSLQKTSYNEQVIASYDYVTALQSLNDRNNAEQSVNIRNPEFVVTDIVSASSDTSIITEYVAEVNYINTIPEYYTSVNEVAVNESIGKSRAYWDILQVQVGLDVELSERWSLQIASQLKTSVLKHALNRNVIQNLSNVDKRLHTIGIQMGVTCTL